jgi:hypothetical protein
MAILLTGRWGSLGEIITAKLFAGKLTVAKDSSVSFLPFVNVRLEQRNNNIIWQQ